MYMYLSTHGSQSQCHLPSLFFRFVCVQIKRTEEREEKRKQSLERSIDASYVQAILSEERKAR